jgi:hypothetical protein
MSMPSPKTDCLIEGASFTPGIRRVASKRGSLESAGEACEDRGPLCEGLLPAKKIERIAESTGEGVKTTTRKRQKQSLMAQRHLGATMFRPDAATAPIPRMYIESDGAGAHNKARM